MKLVVCIKQVPDSTALRIDPATHTLRRAGAPAIVNPFDLPAIEEALRLRDQTGGTVTVVTMGPPQAEAALRETLARGADEAVLLCDPAFAGSDTWATSLVLAAAIRRLGGVDAIFCGRQATDGDTAQVGPALAAQLDLPLLAWVGEAPVADAAGITVQRRLDDGTETLRAERPCVLTIGRQIHPVRLASLDRHLAAQHLPIVHWTAGDLGLGPDTVGLKGSPTRVVRLFAPERKQTCEWLAGSPESIARQINQRIRQTLGGANRWKPPPAEAATAAAPIASPDSLTGSVWVVAELTGGRLDTSTFELLGKGRQLASDLNAPLAAILLTPDSTPPVLLQALWSQGADGVVWLRDPRFAPFQDRMHAAALTQAAERFQPSIMLFAATAIGRMLAPQVAVALKTGLTADCTGLDIDPETRNLIQTRPAFGGNLLASIVTPRHRPQLATVRPRVMEALKPETGRRGWVQRLRIDTLPVGGTTRLAFAAEASDGPSLADAAVIVAGGRGMGSAEGFERLRRLAGRLGGQVGASRAAVDAGWMPLSAQVGQTGRTVRPRVYLACGISGQIQHLAGMASADCVIAINRDRDAPIFSVAHLGVVGDWRTILDALLDHA